MADKRHLDWDGCYNIRDLGGLRTVDGRETRRGSVVRSDNLDNLTPEGWSALADYGIRTIIDLRNPHERDLDDTARPAEITTVNVPIDDLADTEFWRYIADNELDGTPLYYPVFLERKPERCAEAVAAVARARPGGVLIHCVVGRDRTGLISLLLLALAGVAPEEIVADYELSTDRLAPLFASWELTDEGARIEEILKRNNTSARAAILGTLDSVHIEEHLRDAGLTDTDVAAVRARLLGL